MKWFAVIGVLLIALIGVLLWKSDSEFRDEVDTSVVPSGREGLIEPTQNSLESIQNDHLLARDEKPNSDSSPGAGPAAGVSESRSSGEVNGQMRSEEVRESTMPEVRGGEKGTADESRRQSEETVVPDGDARTNEIDRSESEGAEFDDESSINRENAQEAVTPNPSEHNGELDDEAVETAENRVPEPIETAEVGKGKGAKGNRAAPLPYTWLDPVQQASPGSPRSDSQFLRDPSGDPILHRPVPTGPGAGFYDPENPFAEAAERLQRQK